MYRSKLVEVEVELALEDFDTEELVEELEERGHYGVGIEILTSIYEKRKMGHDYQTELDQLIWQTLGRM